MLVAGFEDGRVAPRGEGLSRFCLALLVAMDAAGFGYLLSQLVS